MSNLDDLLKQASADIDGLVRRIKVENPEMGPEERAQVVWIEWVQNFNTFMVNLKEVVPQETFEEIYRALLRLGIDKILNPTIEAQKSAGTNPAGSHA